MKSIASLLEKKEEEIIFGEFLSREEEGVQMEEGMYSQTTFWIFPWDIIPFIVVYHLP